MIKLFWLFNNTYSFLSFFILCTWSITSEYPLYKEEHFNRNNIILKSINFTININIIEKLYQ